MIKIKILNFLILLTLFFTILFSIISYNFISKETIKKKFFLVKKNDIEYIQVLNEEKDPIINNNSIKDFAKKSMIQIFNYENAFAMDKLQSLENIFSDNGYINFYPTFEYVVNSEYEKGTILKEVIVSDGPYFMGTFNYLDTNIYQVYAQIYQSKYGLSGDVEHETKKIFILIREDDFSKSNKGLSIEGITII